MTRDYRLTWTEVVTYSCVVTAESPENAEHLFRDDENCRDKQEEGADFIEVVHIEALQTPLEKALDLLEEQRQLIARYATTGCLPCAGEARELEARLDRLKEQLK